MIYLAIALIIIIGLIYFNPYIDIFKDYRNRLRIILWYNWKNKRNHIDLNGE